MERNEKRTDRVFLLVRFLSFFGGMVPALKGNVTCNF